MSKNGSFSIRDYFEKYLKISIAFDLVFIIIFWMLIYFFKDNIESINTYLDIVVSENSQLENILALAVLAVPLLIAFLRQYFILKKYIKLSNILLSPDKTILPAKLSQGLLSFLIFIFFILYAFLADSIFEYIIYTIIMEIGLVIIDLVTVNIIGNEGIGKDDFKSEMAQTSVLSMFIFLLNQIQGDLITILTWFLPILFPIFIGEINNYSQCDKVQTKKMKRHLYWLSIMGFNTLIILNILYSLVTYQVIVGDRIIEKNILGDYFINSSFLNVFPSIISNFLLSLLLVMASTIIGFILSENLIKLLEKYYLDPLNGYFKETQDIEIIEETYKKQIASISPAISNNKRNRKRKNKRNTRKLERTLYVKRIITKIQSSRG